MNAILQHHPGSRTTDLWKVLIVALLTMFLPAFAVAQDALTAADTLINDAITRGDVPRAVLLVSVNGNTVHKKAYGYAQLFEYEMRQMDKPELMTTERQFDLASMTKVLATTMGIMLLVYKDVVRLDDPVRKYLPEFTSPSKDCITVRHLLQHSSGLYQWQPLHLYAKNRCEAFREICRLPLQAPVGKERRYSDLGFMLLGYIFEKVSGSALDVFLKENLYDPLGLKSTLFNPLEHGFRKFAATSHGNPYEYRMVADTAFGYRVIGDPSPEVFKGWRRATLKGESNDGNCFYANQGMAGHAGLFSTADDVNVLFCVVLNEGVFAGWRYFKKSTIDTFLVRTEFGHGLGWQLTNVAGAGEDSVLAFGHTGFTGTSGIAVPQHRLVRILLANRQNVGLRSDGYYSNIRPLEASLTQLMVRFRLRMQRKMHAIVTRCPGEQVIQFNNESMTQIP